MDILSVFIITGKVIGFATLLYKCIIFVRNKLMVRQGDELQIEYWRFFGPSVPRLMELIQLKPVANSIDSYHVKFSSHKGNHIIERPMWSLYLTVKDQKNISVSGALLWDKYVGTRDQGRRLDFLSKPSDDKSMSFFIEDNYLDQSMDMPERPTIKDDRDQFNFQDDVGFLFLSIKNDGATKLKKVNLKFKEAEMSEQIPTYSTPNRWSYGKIEEAFKAKGDPGNYLPGVDTEFSKNVELVIPNWQPGVEFLFLLSVYRSNLEGFEKNYLDSAYRLESLEGNVSGRKTKWEVREPLREKSIRERVPYGWFRQ